jgi:hypothetical protein
VLGALDAATWANIALATLTALLFAANVVLVRRAKTQADAARDQADAAKEQARTSAELVAIARRDLAATAMPHIVQIVPLGEVTGGRFARGGVVANLRNLGGANAEYQFSTLRLIYGGEVMRGKLLGHGPIIKPDEQFAVQFMSQEEWPSGGSGHLEFHYQGPGSGTQRVAVIDLGWAGESIRVHNTRQENVGGPV